MFLSTTILERYVSLRTHPYMDTNAHTHNVFN